MHTLFMPPVGWGFMLVHSLESEAAVVTDGGSITPCFSEAIKTVKDYLMHVISRDKPWAWILSHLDNDHYSITAALVDQGVWPEPGAVVLPGAYSESVCRKAYLHYLELTHIVAELLRVPPPSIFDLLNILMGPARSGDVIGVFQGTRLEAGGLVYHVIWPPGSEAYRMCIKLIEELNEKIERALRKCRERGVECDKALERANEEGKILEIVLRSVRVAEGRLSLDRKLLEYREDRAVLRSKEILQRPRTSTRPEEIHPEPRDEIYVRADAEFRELELLRLHRSVVNALSLAYAIEFEDRSSHIVEVRIKDFQAPGYSGSGEDYAISVLRIYSPLLFYPADLDGNELNQAIHYYRRHGRYVQNVAVEVAAHHGNAYASELRSIVPCITFIPRCHQHPSRKMKGNFKYRLRFWGLPVYARVLADHSYGIEVRVW